MSAEPTKSPEKAGEKAPDKAPDKAPEKLGADAARSVALSAVEGARKAAGTLRDFHEEERLGRAYDAQLLGRLWPFMRPHAKFLVASLSMIVVAAGLNLVRPVVMGRLWPMRRTIIRRA